MKLTTSGTLYKTEAFRPDAYTVTSPRSVTTIIDRDENILDLFPFAALRYTLDEAEKLVQALKDTWPDYEDDPYYKQGHPIYPIFQSAYLLRKAVIDIHKYDNFTIYRYQSAGEYIYGITTRWTEESRKKAIEAPMDGWEKWLKDRQNMLKDKWIADNLGNF